MSLKKGKLKEKTRATQMWFKKFNGNSMSLVMSYILTNV